MPLVHSLTSLPEIEPPKRPKMHFSIYFGALICFSLAYQGLFGKGINFTTSIKFTGRGGRVLGIILAVLGIGFVLLAIFFENFLLWSSS